MNQIDEIAHIIQLSIAPGFLLTRVGTLLNVLSGRLARIIDRARALEQRLETHGAPHPAAIVNELLSTISALSVCFVIAALFASSMLRYSVHLIVSRLFIAAMLT